MSALSSPLRKPSRQPRRTPAALPCDAAANLARFHPELSISLHGGLLSFEYSGPMVSPAQPAALPELGRNGLLRRAGTHYDGTPGTTLLRVDIDHLAPLQAAWGHADSEKLIETVGQRLAAIDEAPILLVRIEGGSFALLLPVAAGDPEPLARRILQACRTPLTLSGDVTSISVSVGFARVPEHGTSLEELLRNAELALMRAQHEGGDRHAGFDAAHLQQLRRRDALIARLRQAVAQREFVLAYQPIVDATGRTVGAEALLRWPTPETPAPSTAEVIVLLEETGLIEDVGRWILREACRQAAAWRRQQADFSMHVNLSPLQLRSPTLVSEVLGLLREHDLPSDALQLEVTEGMLIDRHDIAVRHLAELAAADLRVWIDDFGTGYSSLSYLRLLPISGIKIDRSFVANAEGPGGEALLVALSQIGGSLSLELIAEGVESTAQGATLRRLGIDHHQGHVYGAAALPAQFGRDFLRAR